MAPPAARSFTVRDGARPVGSAGSVASAWARGQSGSTATESSPVFGPAAGSITTISAQDWTRPMYLYAATTSQDT